MAEKGDKKRSLTRREFLQSGAAVVAAPVLCHGQKRAQLRPGIQVGRGPTPVERYSHIYHSRNGTPAQNVAKVFEMAYGGVHNFIGQNDIVLLRPNQIILLTDYS